MDDATKRIADGLKRAIQTELDGYHFFKMAAATTQDPKGREVFEALAAEELEHEAFLRHQYDHVVRFGTFDRTSRLTQRVNLDGDDPIFSPALRERIRDANFEMSALSIGIQLELQARRYYEEQAAATGDPAVREFFEHLAAWEGRHYDALLRQQESLREDFWNASGFSPM